VSKAVQSVFATRTVFIIAHRLSTIQHADIILVINKGCIVEMGPPSELLLREKGAYRRLVAIQRDAHRKPAAIQADDIPPLPMPMSLQGGTDAPFLISFSTSPTLNQVDNA
jgi:ABC-type multidrug transport system ATPase subunit